MTSPNGLERVGEGEAAAEPAYDAAQQELRPPSILKQVLAIPGLSARLALLCDRFRRDVVVRLQLGDA